MVNICESFRGVEHQCLEELIPGSAGDDLKLVHPAAPKKGLVLQIKGWK